jgi:hypothetical protein
MSNDRRSWGGFPAAFIIRDSEFDIRHSAMRAKKVGRPQECQDTLAGRTFPDIAKNLFAKNALI